MKLIMSLLVLSSLSNVALAQSGPPVLQALPDPGPQHKLKPRESNHQTAGNGSLMNEKRTPDSNEQSGEPCDYDTLKELIQRTLSQELRCEQATDPLVITCHDGDIGAPITVNRGLVFNIQEIGKIRASVNQVALYCSNISCIKSIIFGHASSGQVNNLYTSMLSEYVYSPILMNQSVIDSINQCAASVR